MAKTSREEHRQEAVISRNGFFLFKMLYFESQVTGRGLSKLHSSVRALLGVEDMRSENCFDSIDSKEIYIWL